MIWMKSNGHELEEIKQLRCVPNSTRYDSASDSSPKESAYTADLKALYTSIRWLVSIGAVRIRMSTARNAWKWHRKCFAFTKTNFAAAISAQSLSVTIDSVFTKLLSFN